MGRKELDTTEQLSFHLLWLQVYLEVFCLSFVFFIYHIFLCYFFPIFLEQCWIFILHYWFGSFIFQLLIFLLLLYIIGYLKNFNTHLVKVRSEDKNYIAQVALTGNI